MDYLSSMFIDNELDLDEKRRFLERILTDHAFYTLTMELLSQEQQIRRSPLPHTQWDEQPWRPPVWSLFIRLFKPLGFATAGFAAAVLMLFFVFNTPVPAVNNNRFVLFEPSANQVELAGSFTGWQRVAMHRIGDSGYWELNLDVPAGEHRFAYILDGGRQIADPTVPTSEKDDFGGHNSILNVEQRL